ncbi:hypothetical protein HNY73_019736 [Argiope bruennichi]|uniref:Uncharacterized protein n=1 Tax=Argiope bruennichi TaxID=94029 RepID=A0A8T0E5S5_ARGBR|nr:hypothetical protein HNY73_019736 [Argiope bruennichi]
MSFDELIKGVEDLTIPAPQKTESWNIFFDSIERAFRHKKVPGEFQAEILALASNPKLQVDSDGKYLFKPPYNIKDRRSLLKLLDKHDQQGLGGLQSSRQFTSHLWTLFVWMGVKEIERELIFWFV